MKEAINMLACEEQQISICVMATLST